MVVESGARARIAAAEPDASGCCYLQSFELYETRSKFYLFGSDENEALWKVLKIDRLAPSELHINEDSTTYSKSECFDLLRRIDEGNRATGGLKFVTNCYGIIGFVKFLGPYYMLLITERKEIGNIIGHTVYEVTKSEMVMLPSSSMQFDVVNTKNESRYKKLLSTIDLTKDFFFSYSYHIMRSLQNNICEAQNGQALYESMFVWNEFLTRGIRTLLKNSLWTVALVYGFFKQDKLSLSGRDFILTLVARRSRHYAGTRYLKRGVNKKGRVANDVETEQIVFEDNPGECPAHICSVVQHRGSIPLFWSQETSILNLRPNIIVHHSDKNYEATRRHFENLGKRYGNPIIILNLIKRRERKPRESLLHREFHKAIKFINKDLPEENHLRFLHWDLHENYQSKSINVLTMLMRVASEALNLTGFFYHQVAPATKHENALNGPVHLKGTGGPSSCDDNSNGDNSDSTDVLGDGSQEDACGSSDTSGCGISEDKIESNEICLVNPPLFQKGVLRTNCIDCLDRTNVAQYAYGLAAIGHQLHALHIVDAPEVGLDDPLAHCLMQFYERMGDTLARQYGGSAAHNKIFSERRGHAKLVIQSQEFFRTLQRHYSNACTDSCKQAAINLFLGYFQPQDEKPAIWELDSDQHCNTGEHGLAFADYNSRLFIKRAQSDGNILRESSTLVSKSISGLNGVLTSALSARERLSNALIDLAPQTSSCECEASYSRYTPSMSRQLLTDRERTCCKNYEDSNFLDLDQLSSSGYSREEEIHDRSALNSPVVNLSTENVVTTINAETTTNENGSSIEGDLSVGFAHWVKDGGSFYW